MKVIMLLYQKIIIINMINQLSATTIMVKTTFCNREGTEMV